MWKDNKVLQFAVGVTAMILLVRWLLTGDLLFATQVAMERADPESDQSTRSILTTTLWPLFFEAMCIIGASIPVSYTHLTLPTSDLV